MFVCFHVSTDFSQTVKPIFMKKVLSSVRKLKSAVN